VLTVKEKGSWNQDFQPHLYQKSPTFENTAALYDADETFLMATITAD